MSEATGFGLADTKSEGSPTPYDRASTSAGSEERSADHVTLASGRQFYANRGILGLGPDGQATQGYDGGFGSDDWNDTEVLTADERQEVAEMMIDRWRCWATNT